MSFSHPARADLSINAVTLAISPSGRATLTSSPPRQAHTSRSSYSPTAAILNREMQQSYPSAPAQGGLWSPSMEPPTTPTSTLIGKNSSPGRFLLRQYTMASPSPSPKKRSPLQSLGLPAEIVEAPLRSRSKSSHELLQSVETLLESAHLLPSGWMPLLVKLVAEGNDTLEGSRRGPSALAALIELGEKHRNDCSAASLFPERSSVAPPPGLKRRSSDSSALGALYGDGGRRKKAARPLPPSPTLEFQRASSLDFPITSTPTIYELASLPSMATEDGRQRDRAMSLPSPVTTLPPSHFLLPSPFVDNPTQFETSASSHGDPASQSSRPARSTAQEVPSRSQKQQREEQPVAPAPVSLEQVVKRKPGRPKGSKTKNKNFTIYEEIVEDRPRASGSKLPM